MSGANQRRTPRPDAPILDAGLDPHGTDHADTATDQPHTEFAVGLQRGAGGRTTLRHHQNTPPTLPEFAPMALSEAEMALRRPMVAHSPIPRRFGAGRTKPPPLPPPTPAPTDEIAAAVGGHDEQAGLAVVSLTATPPPAKLRSPASAPLDPAAFASPKMTVDRLIDQVIDEVDALTPSKTSAPATLTDGPASIEQPGAAVLIGPRTPVVPLGPRERGTEMVDGQAVAIDRAVSRAVQTGMAAPPARAPAAWTDDSSLKVVLGRPALASAGPSAPGLDAVVSSGLELAYEPRAPGVRRSRRVDPRFTGASAAREASIMRPLSVVVGLVIGALMMLSILRSFDFGF